MHSLAAADSNRGAIINAWENELKHMIASRSRQEAVFKPAPKEGLVKCYVKRVKNFFGTHASFQMHLENGDVFLLAARRWGWRCCRSDTMQHKRYLGCRADC